MQNSELTDIIFKRGKQLIDCHDIVSFDVFDTLIVRDCAEPADIFDLVEKKYNLKKPVLHDFRQQRIEAERVCAKRIDSPTIDEIYSVMNCDDKDLLKTLEIDTEKKMCIRKHLGYSLYCYAKERGKRIIAISDMYLGSNTIKDILETLGYDIEIVVVSCEHRAEKHDGKLFNIALEKIHANRKDVIHFGDNPVADVLGAYQSGMASLYIPPQPQLSYLKRSGNVFGDNYLIPFIKNRVTMISNRNEALGYEIGGPLIVGFCQWIDEKQKKEQYKSILFLARDMQLPFLCYNLMYPDNANIAHYFYASQKSIKRAYKGMKNRNVLEEEHEQFRLIRKYIDDLGCSGKIALVDSGESGKTQMMLSEILSDKCNINGYYMRISKDFQKNVNDPTSCAYLYGNSPSTLYTISGRFFESLLTAFHGRTEEYQIDNLGRISPVFGKANLKDYELMNYRKGVMRFIYDFKKSGIYSVIEPIVIQDAFLRFAFFPLKKDADVFKNAKTGNSEYENIIIQRERSYYFKHPKCFFQDLMKTAWKGGFLCNCFSFFYLPICLLYLLIDSCLIKYCHKQWNE